MVEGMGDAVAGVALVDKGAHEAVRTDDGEVLGEEAEGQDVDEFAARAVVLHRQPGVGRAEGEARSPRDCSIWMPLAWHQW